MELSMYDIRLELMPFKKFAQSQRAYPSDEKRLLIGVFKDKKTGEIVKGDNFEALVCGTAEKTYRLYLLWNNLYFDENREFVSAKWDKSIKSDER